MKQRRLPLAIICLAVSISVACRWGGSNISAAAVVPSQEVHDQGGDHKDSDDSRILACGTTEIADKLKGANPAPGIVPALQEWSGAKGTWALSPKSRILIEPANAARLQPLAVRLSKDVAEVSGVKLPIVTGTDVKAGDIALSLFPCDASIIEQIGDEGYTLLANQSVILRANQVKGISDHTEGLFYATRTFLQMLMLSKNHKTVPQGFAIDYPLYHERALMFDVGRAFADKEFLEAYMKFMGWYKLNTLELHLSDDITDETLSPGNIQRRGFRLHSMNPNFKNPPLSDDGMYYSKSDWNELEDVAAANGITIIPEIDTPGHAGAMVAAIQKAYPDTKSKGVELDVTDPRTLEYVESVWNEFLPWFRSKTVCIGADEATSNREAQIKFAITLEKFLAEKGKRVCMWNDLVSGNAPFDKDTIIDVWRGKIAWDMPKFKWVNASHAFYVTPDWASYQESRGFAGDSFYADDSALKIAHPNSDREIWNWFGNTAAVFSGKDYPPIGGQISVWNDGDFHHSYTYERLVHYLVRDVIPAAGQIWWSGQRFNSSGNLIPYSTLRKSVAQLQYGPRVVDVAMFSKYPLPSKTPTFDARPVYRIRPAYLAQDAHLSGTATKTSCGSCDGGEVEHIGQFHHGEGTLMFSISVPVGGTYMLPIYYVSGSSAVMLGQVSVNGKDAITAVFPPTGGVSPSDHSRLTPNDEKTLLRTTDQQGIMAIFVPLKAGSNSIKFFSSIGEMPNIGGLGIPLLQPNN